MVKGLKQLVGKNIRLFRKASGRDVLIFRFLLVFAVFRPCSHAGNHYELTLPVVYEPVPQHISITNTLPKSFKVTLRDKGIVLHQYFIHRKEMAVRLNPMDWYRQDGIGKVDRLLIESYIRQSLDPTTELISLYPDTVSFYFLDSSHKCNPKCG